MWDIDENVNQLVKIEDILLFVYEEAVVNLNFICNFDNLTVMKQRRWVSISLFKIDNPKCLLLENVETVNCANVLFPFDASIVNLWFK